MARVWYLASSLVALRNELNAAFPLRDKTSDGSVGDTSHQATKSDHNPDWDDNGIVRALDVDEDLDGNPTDSGGELLWLVERIVDRRDPRVAYLIYEGLIWRSYDKPGLPAWTPERYWGVNAHRKHLHVSINHNRTSENDTSSWLAVSEEDDMPYSPQELKAMMRQAVAEEFGTAGAPTRTAVVKLIAAEIGSEAGRINQALDSWYADKAAG